MLQHIGLVLLDERGNAKERSPLNFAPIMETVFQINDFENRYPLLSGIDPYGGTSFNTIQTPRLIKEIKILKKEPIAAATTKEIDESVEFLEKVKRFSFAKFLGD